MIDVNQSISLFDFPRQQDFVKAVVKTLTEKRIRLQAAIVTYSDSGGDSDKDFVKLNLSRKFSVNDFNSIIDDLSHLPEKAPSYKEALQFTEDHILKPAFSGPTSHLPKIVFGITTRKILAGYLQTSVKRFTILHDRHFVILDVFLFRGGYVPSKTLAYFVDNSVIPLIGKNEIKSFCFSLKLLDLILVNHI